jgi:hypothetical protein
MNGRTLLQWHPRAVARAPASNYTKLFIAFIAIVGLLLVVDAVGLAELAQVNRRAEDQVKLQRKIAAYRQIQHDTIAAATRSAGPAVRSP